MFTKHHFSFFLSFFLLLSIFGQETTPCQLLVRPYEKAPYSLKKETYKKNIKPYLDSLYQRGFYTLSIDSTQTSELQCLFFATLGKRYTHFIKGEEITTIDSLKNTINKDLSDEGRTFAQYTLVPKKIAHDSIEVGVIYHDLEQRKINDLVIIGYDKAPQKLLSSFLKDKVYTPQEVLEFDRKLDQLTFINRYQPSRISFQKDSTLVYSYLKKRGFNSFDGLVGFSSQENGKVKFEGQFDLELHNLFNRFEKIAVHWASGLSDTQDFSLETEFPHLFQSKIGFNSGLKVLIKDSTQINLRFSNAFTYTTQKQDKLYLNLNLQSSRQKVNDQFESINKSGIGVGYSKTNVISQKINRVFYAVYLNYNHWTSTEKTEEELVYSLAKQFKLQKNLYIHLHLLGNNLLSGSDFREDELYREGGFNSVRGFVQQSIYTNSYNQLSSTIKLIPNDFYYFQLFFDYAYINNLTLHKLEPYAGIGLGLGYLSPVGLFEIGYAVGKAPENSFDFNNGKIHLGLKATF